MLYNRFMPSIPVTAAPFFQEYAFPSLDVEKHAALVIERILAYGDRAEVRWLFETYGLDRVRAWVEQEGTRLLSRRRYQLWTVMFDIPVPDRIAERRQAWPY
jgi:hypothetical protein